MLSRKHKCVKKIINNQQLKFMKNLFKLALVFTLLLSSFAFSQKYVNENAEELLSAVKESTSARKRVLLFCNTISCCGIGSFGIEIWSDKECHYVVVGKRVAVLGLRNTDGSDFKGSEIEIKEDVTLIDKDHSLEKDGMEAVMKAGTYKVVNGEVAFEAAVQRIRIKKACYVETHQGHIFGHEYSYTTSICVYYPSFSNQTRVIHGGYAEIDITKDEKLLNIAKENGNMLSFDEDLIFGNGYLIKAGKYLVEEGKIYTRNIQLK